MSEAWRIEFQIQHSPDSSTTDFRTIGYGVSYESGTFEEAIHMTQSALQNGEYDYERVSRMPVLHDRPMWTLRDLRPLRHRGLP